MNGYILLPKLTLDEVSLCYHHAVDRRMKKLAGEREDREQLDRSTLDNELNGACAEYAMNKYYDSFPKGFSGVGAPDCPAGEVRWVCDDDHRLIIYPRNEGRCILTQGFAPQYWGVGWAWARDGKRESWRVKKAGYYLVPRSQLHPGLPSWAEVWEEMALAAEKKVVAAAKRALAAR